MHIAIISDCNVEYLKKYLAPKFKSIKAINGGAPSVTNTIEGFLSLGHQVTVFKLSSLIEQKVILQGELLTIVLIPYKANKFLKFFAHSFIAAPIIRKEIRNSIHQFDYIHAQWSYENILAISYLRKKQPIFCTPRDWASYIFKISSLKNELMWINKYIVAEYIYSLNNIHYIANSPYTQSLIQKRTKQTNIPIIPNPINDSFLIEKREFYPERPVLLSILTSYDKRKNCDTLLVAFNLLLKTYPDAQLHLVGTPYTEENPVMNTLKKQGLLKNVILHGSIPHNKIKELMLNSSMLIHPSTEETFGNTLIEAMGCKLPVIGGKNSGAVPYVLNHGICGILCDILSPNDICNSIIKLMDSKTRNQYINRGYNYVKEHYTQKSVALQHIEFYKSIR